MRAPTSIKDLGRAEGPLAHIESADQPPLPPPYDKAAELPELGPLKPGVEEKVVVLDDTVAINIPVPKTKDEEEQLVEKFLSGMRKTLSPADNWTFLQPLLLSLDHCAKCQTCSEACHIYEESGRNPLYRPSYRSEIVRRIYWKHVRGGTTFARGDIDLDWRTVTRLIELAYRCNLCRRCAQSCPIGVDNALLAREIRKIASQEMGLSSKECHDTGSMLQLRVGSSTGMNALVAQDNCEFIVEDMNEKTGLDCSIPWDKEGADILLMHNAGEIMAWPENVGAFAAIFNAAGVSWTLSSEHAAYDSINYGVWYDDVQFARTAILHAKAAAKLKVKRIVFGECGHAHKALTVIADKVLTGELNVPREAAMPVLREAVLKLHAQGKLDPKRNDFPVTLHDPCNYVRLMGVVKPQREILALITPPGRFREMEPHGVHNYCCGGGSGFAIMSGHNFGAWRHHLSGRRKLRQILEAFKNTDLTRGGKDSPKYVCAPCSNCKGQLRDIIAYYDVWERSGISYGGLVELVVNAMVDAKPGFIDWEWH
jgi:Fe-S oxidoreductase